MRLASSRSGSGRGRSPCRSRRRRPGCRDARRAPRSARPRERRRVDAHLVGARLEHRGRVGDGADAAAERERDRDLLRDRARRPRRPSRAASSVAEMSRKTSSSAPASEYAAPSSTGSPTSRSSWKRTPLTTRPPATSRQGSGAGEASLQEPCARGAALLGMELHAGERAMLDDRGEALRLVATAAGVSRRRSARTRYASSPGSTSAQPMRGTRPSAAAPRGRERAEPVDAAVLLTLVERELEAEADAEDRPACGRVAQHSSRPRRRARPSPSAPSRRPAAPQGRRSRRRRRSPRRAAATRARPSARCPRRSARSRPFTGRLSSTEARRRRARRGAQRAADRLVRRLGDVVRVASGRLTWSVIRAGRARGSRARAARGRDRARARSRRRAGRRGRRRRARARRPSARRRRRSARCRTRSPSARSSASPNAIAVSSAV